MPILLQTKIISLTEMEYKTLAGYKMLMRENARGLWAGSMDWFDFYESMQSTIARGFNQAWEEGMKKFNMSRDDMTQNERTRLQQEINQEWLHIAGVADFIESHSKDNGGKLSTCQQRIERWVAAYSRILQLAAAMAGKDKPMEWVYGDTVHCSDCLRLNGRVYRASVWVDHGLLPKSWDLECHGIHCQCELRATTKPLTRGRPPTLN